MSGENRLLSSEGFRSMPALRPIGVIRTPFTSKKQTPIQPYRSQAQGRVEVWAEYEAGLQNVDSFSHVILLYFFHDSDLRYDLMVTPFLDDEPKGLFATRFPRRPNAVGLSVVRLVRLEGRVLHVDSIDVLDGTPLLDIKPYVPPFDAFPQATLGWLEGRA